MQRESTWYWRIWWWFGYHGLFQLNWWWRGYRDWPWSPPAQTEEDAHGQ